MDKFNSVSEIPHDTVADGLRAAHPAWSDQEIEKAVREIFLYAVT